MQAWFWAMVLGKSPKLPGDKLSCFVLQIKQLAEEIMAHVRGVVGGEAMLQAFNAARRSVTAVRSERRRKAATQVLLNVPVHCFCTQCDCMFVGIFT